MAMARLRAWACRFVGMLVMQLFRCCDCNESVANRRPSALAGLPAMQHCCGKIIQVQQRALSHAFPATERLRAAHGMVALPAGMGAFAHVVFNS